MDTDTARELLDQLSRGVISMDEADRALAALDAPEHDGPPEPLYDEPSTAEIPTPASTRVPPARRDRDLPVVSVRLSGSSLINAVGVVDVDEPLLEGPHHAQVTEVANGYEVTGQLEDEGLLILPREVDLLFEANSGAVSLRGIRGCLQAVLNVGAGDVALHPIGESHIVADVGHLRLTLHPDSDVAIRLTCATSIKVADEIAMTGRGVWRMGSGTATLEIGGSPGDVTVEVSEA